MGWISSNPMLQLFIGQTIRLILIISIILNWTTVQMDNTNALAQAPLEEEIYMEIPRDFTAADVDNEYVLKMNKSL